MSLASPIAGVLTNVKCSVDLAATPPRSRIVLELAASRGSAAPAVRVVRRARAVAMTVPRAVLNMPGFRLPVHDGLIEALVCRDDGAEITVTAETSFPALAEVAWSYGLPARLTVDLPRLGPARVLAGRRIGLDPGHGGRDAGAVGVGYREADIALAICGSLAHWLRSHGAAVVETRTLDHLVPDDQRLDLLRSGLPCVYLGVHAGAAADRRRRGTSVLYRRDAESKSLARLLLNAILTKSPFLLDNGLHPSNEGLLGRLRLPAVVVLPEHITSHLGEGLLRDIDFRERIVQSLFDGLLAYFRTRA